MPPERAGVLFRRPVPPSAWDRRFSSKQSLAPARRGVGKCAGANDPKAAPPSVISRWPLEYRPAVANSMRPIRRALGKCERKGGDALGPLAVANMGEPISATDFRVARCVRMTEMDAAKIRMERALRFNRTSYAERAPR